MKINDIKIKYKNKYYNIGYLCAWQGRNLFVEDGKVVKSKWPDTRRKSTLNDPPPYGLA